MRKQKKDVTITFTYEVLVPIEITATWIPEETRTHNHPGYPAQTHIDNIEIPTTKQTLATLDYDVLVDAAEDELENM